MRGAFSGCRRLNSIVVEEGNLHYASEEGVLFNADRSTLILCPEGKSGTYSIPRGVTTISGIDQSIWPMTGLGAFSDCTGLTSVSIPSSVTEIGESAFAVCTGLTSVTIPASVSKVGYGAFQSCTGLTSGIFLGNPPKSFGYNNIDPDSHDPHSVFRATAHNFTIYYTSGSSGFTSPTWNGYPTTMAQSSMETN